MANKLDPMDLKQIITLRLEGFSNRQIGNQPGIGRNTVNHYIVQFEASEKSLEALLALDNAKLEACFPSTTTIKNQRYNQLMLFFEKVNRAREFTFQYHHQLYKDEHPDGYGYTQFMEHYHCVVNPTRSYAPQDKALVENAVQLAYQRIYHPLREMVFFSLADLNREIRKLLEGNNNLLFQRKEASRKELFQSVERQYLKPLPTEPYELKNYCRAKVQKMGYVYFSPEKVITASPTVT